MISILCKVHNSMLIQINYGESCVEHLYVYQVLLKIKLAQPNSLVSVVNLRLKLIQDKKVRVFNSFVSFVSLGKKTNLGTELLSNPILFNLNHSCFFYLFFHFGWFSISINSCYKVSFELKVVLWIAQKDWFYT